MVVIRLSRGGSKGAPFYNIVVSDSRNRRDGRFIERLGFYNPVGKEGAENFRVASDRLTHWVGKGAQMSDTRHGVRASRHRGCSRVSSNRRSS